jgi:hypothetical protein
LSDIFDEVDEELRADRAQKLLRKYGWALVAAAVLVVLAVGGWKAWKYYQAQETARVAQSYIAAARLADTAGGAGRPAALLGFDTLANGSNPGYRTLARLREAALKADSGDRAAALALWDKIAADGSADRLLRDLASLLWVRSQLDTGEPAVLSSRLVPLLAADNPWHGLATEAQALLELRQGHDDAARDALKRLAQDVTAPDGVRGRANGLLARLGVPVGSPTGAAAKPGG